MVKNESDIVEETIQNLLDQGVDHILVADNGSTDSTRAILSRLSQAGRVHVVDDPIVAYWQGDKMSHLARAATRMGAAWIVPFDADEMWKGEDGLTVATVLRAAETNVVAASWWDFVPLAVVGPREVRMAVGHDAERAARRLRSQVLRCRHGYGCLSSSMQSRPKSNPADRSFRPITSKRSACVPASSTRGPRSLAPDG